MILALLLLSAFASSATISGITYDSSLAPSTSLVEINSTPKQSMVALNGSYSLEVPVGSYLLRAIDPKNFTAEKYLEVNEDGNYRIDLILFTEDDDLAKEFNLIENTVPAIDIETQESNQPQEFPLKEAIILTIILVIITSLGFFSLNRKKTGEAKQEESKQVKLTEDQEKVLSEIRKSNGRITQKDLRKNLSHWSEAKVSMEVTELEEKGAITKLKKGRGNVLRIK